MNKMTPAEAVLLVDRFRQDPSFFFREALGAKTYPKQDELLEAIARHRRVSCVGCNSSGKDWTMGRVILWWLSIWEQARVIVIGPTLRQVDEILWRETRSAYQQSRYPLGGEMYDGTAKYEVSINRVAMGFSTDKPYRITGFHSPHLLVIITEAHGVPQQNIEAVKMLNPEKMVMTGNAWALSGEFFNAHNKRDQLYKTVEITAEDTPNVIEDRIVVPGMLTRQDIADRKIEWGENSPEYQASILAKFTPSAGRNYFDLAAIDVLGRGVLPPIASVRGDAIKVWEARVVGGRYVAAMDCAWGEKGAYDVLTIADFQTGAQVAEIYGRLSDDEMAQESVGLLTMYNRAYVGVEVNSEGRHVVDKMLELGYGDRMYHRDVAPDPQMFLQNGQRPPRKPGWLTDGATRPVMLRELEEATRGRRFVVRCQHAIDEFRTFIRDEKGRPGPMEGGYGDHVMCWAILWQMRKYATFLPDANEQRAAAGAVRRW